MRDIYEAVCRNRIAVLELSLSKGSVGHSVQIPMPFYVSDIYPQASEASRSLWLTTANNVSRYETVNGVSAFDKTFALLLTDDDEKKIIAELQARGDKAAAAMIELVKASKPTLSYVLPYLYICLSSFSLTLPPASTKYPNSLIQCSPSNKCVLMRSTLSTGAGQWRCLLYTLEMCMFCRRTATSPTLPALQPLLQRHSHLRHHYQI